MAAILASARRIGARSVSGVVLASRRIARKDSKLRVRRAGIHWELDLSETIDFSIYMLGAWERRTQASYRRHLQRGDIALDVGANLGGHAIPMAKLVGPSGRVIAIEPTDSAFRKLCRNLALNANLSTRVTPLQMAMLTDPGDSVPGLIYSSWPIAPQRDIHPAHGGRLQQTTGAVASSVDAVVHALSLPRVDFIKIDVDGAEPGVILGAKSTLRRWRPRLFLEWSDHLHAHGTPHPNQALDLLGELGYRVLSKGPACGLPVSPSAATKLSPDGGTWSAFLECGPLE